MSEPKKNSNVPVIIIGIVLLAAIGGGWWLYSQGGAAGTKKTASNSQNKAGDFREIYNSAPAGAEPANIKGDGNATVTIEEFADFACPTCALMNPRINEVHNKFGNRIKIIYRHFPLNIQGHHNSYDASSAAEAAGLQGKFWEMQNLIFTKQKDWQALPDAKKTFEEYAKQLGLNLEKFSGDMLGMAARGRVDLDLKRAQALQLRSTPTLILNGRMLSNDETTTEKIIQLVEAELAKQAGGAAPAANANSGK